MKGSNKLEEGKSKDQKPALISSVVELRRVAEANHLKLQHLELAVANLTSICIAIRKDISSLGLSSQGLLFRKVQAEGTDAKPRPSMSSSPKLEVKKADMLGVQMQQLVEQAAALGILKNPKPTGEMNENRGAPTRLAMRNVQGATKSQKRSTRSLIQTTESTTEKKTSMKLGAVKNMGATQPKVPRNKSPNKTSKVSLKSTVKKTKTTISKVYVESTAKRSKDTAKGSVLAKSSIKKNVETMKTKGSVKLTVKANQGDDSSRSVAKSSALTMSAAPAKFDVKARRKWSTTKDMVVKK